MDVRDAVPVAAEVWPTAVRLHPRWKRRVVILLGAVVLTCVGAVGYMVLGAGRTATAPGTPTLAAHEVIWALLPYASDDAADARKDLIGSKVDDMMARLKVIRDKFVSAKLLSERDIIETTETANQAGVSVVVQVRESAFVPGTAMLTWNTDAYPWTFQTVHKGFPLSGWFVVDFTAPDVCQVYTGC